MLLATSWLGTLPGWLTLLALAGTSWILWRGGGTTAINTLQVANRVLEKRVNELEHQQKRDLETIAELRGRTDVTVALTPLLNWTSHHEERAQERHDGTLKVLALIAERLGPDEVEASRAPDTGRAR